MPVGTALAIQIEQLLDTELANLKRGVSSGPVANAIMVSGGFNDVHLTAMERIRDGIHSKNSIDEFIDDWQDIPELARIAKLCIAQRILSAERGSILGSLDDKDIDIAKQLRSLRDTWLGLISRNANPKERRRDVAKVFSGISFVVFNYDRCIEQFLFHTFTNTHAMSPNEARAVMAKIPILHVYGSLGPFPVPGNGYTMSVPFGAEQTHTAFAAQSIRTFTEEIESGHAKLIQNVVSKAETIVFLGSGYHTQNLRILFPSGHLQHIRIFGTALNMRESARNRLMNYFPSSTYSPIFEPTGCKDFIYKFEEIIFP